MGQHGSCTAALSFGENNSCRGWLLGVDPRENDGKGDGMRQMFQMMNEARMETGHAALACIANATIMPVTIVKSAYRDVR